MIRRPPRSTLSSSSAASDVYKRQVYFFVELEEDEDEELDGISEVKEEAESEDAYAWAKEAYAEPGITEESPPEPESRLQEHDEHPGWLWDPDNEEWVPDSDHSDA